MFVLSAKKILKVVPIESVPLDRYVKKSVKERGSGNR